MVDNNLSPQIAGQTPPTGDIRHTEAGLGKPGSAARPGYLSGDVERRQRRRNIREAVQLANAAPGEDTIQFDMGLPSLDIFLTTSELTITDSLLVDASNLTQPITIDASSADPTPLVQDGAGIRAINIPASTPLYSTRVQLLNLRITGGDVDGPGGAVQSRGGPLTMDHVILEDNQATRRGGTVYHVGPDLRLLDSTVSGNIARPLAGNYPGDGGAIMLYGTGQIDGTVFSDNFAARRGGAIRASLSNAPDLLEIKNSTFFANTAGSGGGLYLGSQFGTIAVSDTTVQDNVATGNGGGDLFAKHVRWADRSHR